MKIQRSLIVNKQTSEMYEPTQVLTEGHTVTHTPSQKQSAIHTHKHHTNKQREKERERKKIYSQTKTQRVRDGPKLAKIRNPHQHR